MTELEKKNMLSYLPGFERHLKILQARSPITISRHISNIHDFFSWLQTQYESNNPKDITRQDIEAYLEHLFYKGNTNATRTTKLIALAKFFRYLTYEGLIEKNPTENIPRPKITRTIMHTFSKDEVYRFFKQCDQKEKGLRDICILILLAFCGLRANEITKINLNDIMDNGKDIDIYVRGKQQHDRIVYLWKSPGQYIRKCLLFRLSHGAKDSDPFIVSTQRKSKDNRFTDRMINYLIKDLAAKAGIRRSEIHPHVFRATHANDLQLVKGYTLPAIQERLGWKDLSTAGRYLVRRERIHKVYDSLHAYWREFTYLWERKEDQDNDPGGTIAELGQ